MQHGFFLRTTGASPGQRFCLFHPARGGSVRGRVVYVHPLCEEMNKSRRMAALQARALAESGFSVLQIDLLGCGDSSGDFGDAGWDDWLADVRLAVNYLRDYDAEHRSAPLWLWGLRAGCLLAAEAAVGISDEACNFCFWQPSAAGKSVLQQLLRLKSAGEMLSGSSKGVMDGLRQQLRQGESVEIAGYLLSAALAEGLERASLRPPANGVPGRLEWFELSTQAGAPLSPVGVQNTAAWAQAGFALHSQVVQGPSFWQTSEIEEAPQLIAATVAALGAQR